MKTTKKYGTKTDLALGMWIKLARAYSTFNKHAVNQIRSFGLTQPQFDVVECLGHLGPMLIGELSKKLLVSGGNMTIIVNNLERDGIVERLHTTSDRREITVQLTKKGRGIFDSAFTKHAEYITELASVLNQKEQEELAKLLKKLGLALQEKNKQSEK